MNKRCHKCRFWDHSAFYNEFNAPDHDHIIGLCRRNAPSPTTDKEWEDREIEFAVWPITKGKDWCGQFKPETKTKI
jgi:hypothetical protein